MKRKFNKGSRCRSGDHPTLCPLFMRGGNRENGCSRRPSDCPNGKHPHICNNSFNRRECYTRGCKYRHLPGTRTVRNAGDTQRPDSRLPRPQYATQGPPRNNAEFPPLTRPPYEPPRAPPPAWSGQARPDTTLPSNNQAQTFLSLEEFRAYSQSTSSELQLLQISIQEILHKLKNDEATLNRQMGGLPRYGLQGLSRVGC